MAAMASRRSWDARAVTREADFQALIQAAPPDAIILDLQLGNSDGIEQLHFLHSVHYGGAIVLMSGFNTRVLAAAQQIGQSLGLYIAAAIEKPVPAARLGDVLSAIERHGTGLVWSPNFSIGSRAFFRLVEEAARLLAEEPEYGAWAWEIHHSTKKDAPSGTLLRLVEEMKAAGFPRQIDVSSSRAGAHPLMQAVMTIFPGARMASLTKKELEPVEQAELAAPAVETDPDYPSDS